MKKTSRSLNLLLILVSMIVLASLGRLAMADSYGGLNPNVVVSGTPNVSVVNTPTVNIGTIGTQASNGNLCFNITSTQVILPANATRTYFSVYGTNGSPSFYANKGATATVPPAGSSATNASRKIQGGAAWTDTGNANKGPYTGQISGVCASGTCWICVDEGN